MTADRWTNLADEYSANRIGYSNELYDTIAAFGLRRGATILDLACGTGIASAPFAANGFPITGVDSSPAMLAKAAERFPGNEFVLGTAEALPFPDERFDVVVSAQAFHWFDRSRALAEAHRVMRSGGTIAIWWKHLMAQDSITEIRNGAFRELGFEPPASGLTGGFKEFYGSQQFKEQVLRVLPWRTGMPLGQFIGYERSRCSVRDALGASAGRYFALLEQRLRRRLGEGDPTVPLAYIQYLYLAKRR